MEPCGKCKKNNKCELQDFVNKHKGCHPWRLDSLLRDYTVEVSLVTSKDGRIVIECNKFESTAPNDDYSSLVNKTAWDPEDIDWSKKPSGCGGGCGGCKH